MTALLHPDEASRLVPGERLVIVRTGDRVPIAPQYIGNVDGWQIVAPQDWVALTGPCPKPHCTHCGRSWLIKGRPETVYNYPEGFRHAVCDDRWDECDCRDGRRIVPLYTECWWKSACAAGDPSVRCVCTSLDASVLAGRGSIEVLPVVTPDDCEWLTFDHLQALPTETLLWRTTGNPHSPYVTTHLPALDPLPVPGRDFGIVIDCVEVAG